MSNSAHILRLRIAQLTDKKNEDSDKEGDQTYISRILAWTARCLVLLIAVIAGLAEQMCNRQIRYSALDVLSMATDWISQERYQTESWIHYIGYYKMTS